MEATSNPFDPPQAKPNAGRIVGDADNQLRDAESIRGQYLQHEAAIRYSSIFFFLAAVACFAGARVILVDDSDTVAGHLRPGASTMAIFASVVYLVVGTMVALLLPGVAFVAGVVLLGGFLCVSIGVATLGFAIEGWTILFVPVELLLQAILLHLIVCKNGQFICSDAYRSIRKETPHIRCHLRLEFKLLFAVALIPVILFIASIFHYVIMDYLHPGIFSHREF